MEYKGGTGEYYTINHVVQFTGLSDRTIRNYITLGILITPEEVDAFLRHPAVRPSIQAKKNGIVYDSLMDRKRKEPQACLILDMPGVDGAGMSARFCEKICNANYENLQYSYDSVGGCPRFILRGQLGDMLALVQECAE